MTNTEIFDGIKADLGPDPWSLQEIDYDAIGKKYQLLIPDRDTQQLRTNRARVQQFVNLARLPGFVQDEYRKLWEQGNDSTAVRWSMIAKLFKVYLDERKQGFVTEPGPKFQELWKNVLQPVHHGVAEKMMTRGELYRATEQLSSRGAQLLILKILGNPVHMDDKPLTVQDIDRMICEAEDAFEWMLNLADIIGPEKMREYVEQVKAKRIKEARAPYVPPTPTLLGRLTEAIESATDEESNRLALALRRVLR